MFVIHSRTDRKQYWEDFWAEVGEDVDLISSDEVYPLYPTTRHLEGIRSILEVGCGMGRVVKHLAAAGRDVTGMDYEPRAILRLHAQRPQLKLYVGDVNCLPHPDSSFDAALCYGTLSNLPDTTRALAELRRVLKPGGLLVASVTNDSVARRVLSRLSMLGAKQRAFAMVAYTRREWAARVESAGFSIVETTPIVTRLPIYTFLPFLRSRKTARLDWRVARDGDTGLKLNAAGEWVFRAAFRHVPFSVSHGVVAVARARK